MRLPAQDRLLIYAHIDDHATRIREACIMKSPGPEHPITVQPAHKRVRVRFGGKTIADSERALVLQEASYKPVFYVPREDADMNALARTAHHSHCPYKGDASYFTISAGGKNAENAVWSYEKPYPALAVIKNHLAFYPDRVDEIEEVPTG